MVVAGRRPALVLEDHAVKRTLTTIAAGLLAATLAVPAVAGKRAEWKTYGAEITLKQPTKLAGASLGSEMLTSGKVTEVCRNKGCWMTVADGKQTVRVEFKDYGFFVPWGSEGKRVRMQGVLQEKVMSPEEQAHVAAESRSGHAPEAGGTPKRVRVFVASAMAIEGGTEIGAEQRRKIGGTKPEHEPGAEPGTGR